MLISQHPHMLRGLYMVRPAFGVGRCMKLDLLHLEPGSSCVVLYQGIAIEFNLLWG
jgi:hypothetical protein